MLRLVFIGGLGFWGVCYVASRYARKKLEDRQNPLAPFAS